jgi:outer membrane protein assembly factor BamB
MRLPLLAITISLLAFFHGSSLADNWSQFRGPQGDGQANGAKLPDQWSPENHLAWKVKIPGAGWSQPVVWGDKVFLTTTTSEKQVKPKPGDFGTGAAFGGIGLLFGGGSLKKAPTDLHKWHVLCLDRETGKIVWEQIAKEDKPRTPIHYNNSYSTETPATDGERLIAYFGMTGLYCYDLAGKLLWSKDLGSYPTQLDWGSASSPVIHEGLVFIQCDNDKSSFLVALDKHTGDEKWRVTREEQSNWSTPYLWKNEKRTELVTAGGTKMRSYEPLSGKLLWEMAAAGRCSMSPVATDTLLYVDSGVRLTGQQGAIVAIRPGAEGDISLQGNDTTSSFVAWTAKLSSTRVASPLVLKDCLYVLEQQSGISRCLDAKTGAEHYRKRIPGATGFTASPWAAGGKAYFLDQTGQTFVIEPGPALKVLATNKLDDPMFWSSPAIAGNSILFRGNDHLFCVR